MGYDGIGNGSPTYAAAVFGNGMVFSPGNGFHLNSGGPISFASNTPFTLECRLKIATAPGGIKVIVGMGNNGYIGLESNGRVRFSATSTAVSSTTIITDNAFHAIACTYDGTNMQVYVDGTREAQAATANVTTSQALTVGTGFGGGSTFDASGTIDELSICSDCKYSSASYSVSGTRFVSTRTNQTALYHFDGDVADTNGLAALASAGNLIVTDPSLGAVVINTPTTGGIGTKVYSYHGSATIGFTPGSGNLISNSGGNSGATTATLTYGVSISGNFYIVGTVSDDDGTTFTTPQRLLRAAQS